jgi:hypothetical protein
MELPHWLIIAGAIFILFGFLGLAFTRNGEAASETRPQGNDGVPPMNPDPDPPAPRQKMPPKPPLLDSSNQRTTNDRGKADRGREAKENEK